MLLIVLVKALKLVDEGFGHWVDGGHLVGSNGHVDIFKVLDDWVEPLVLDAVKWLDHQEVVFFLLIFFDDVFDRGEMLIVGEVDVVQ